MMCCEFITLARFEADFSVDLGSGVGNCVVQAALEAGSRR